jgi:CheY-like chemotaxis protein
MAIDLTRLNILLVDDNQSMRHLVKQILTAFGIKNVHECADGSDALQEMRNFPADLIIADWMMEPVDGLDMARLIRTAPDSPNPFVPIIMLTGHTERHRVEEARDAGVTEFLAKPISASAVYQRLTQIIEHPRPFVRTRRFTGPDRRRHRGEGADAAKGRRATDPEAVDIDTDEAAGLSQDDVEKLLKR